MMRKKDKQNNKGVYIMRNTINMKSVFNTWGQLLFAIFGVYALIVSGYALYQTCYGINLAMESPVIGEAHFAFGITWFLIGMGGLFLSCLGLSVIEYTNKKESK